MKNNITDWIPIETVFRKRLNLFNQNK